MVRRRTEISTTIGLIVGVGGLILGFLLGGGNLIALLNLSAIVIILGGTFGAVIVSYSIKEFLTIPKLFMETLRAPRRPTPELAAMLVEFSEKSRRDGILSLEEIVDGVEDRFFQKALQLVIDGGDPELIVTMLENDINVYEGKKKEEYGLLEAAGGFSPTMGIIGTVMGLIVVLQTIGGDPGELGRAIAVAFTATFYGIAFANVFWLPLANKLKGKMKQEKNYMEFIIIGVLSIQNGENPTILKRKIETYFPDEYGLLEDKSEGG